MAKSNGKKKKPAAKQPNNNRNPADHLAAYKWPPGVSGNPNGKPPGSKSWLQAHKEEWEKPAPERVLKSLAGVMFGDDREAAIEWVKGSVGKVTWLEAIVRRNNFKAITPGGDFIVKTMWEQNDGRPTLKIVGPDDGPLQVQQVDYKKLNDDELRALRELIAKATTKENGDEG